jgi:hypothetical protein
MIPHTHITLFPFGLTHYCLVALHPTLHSINKLYGMIRFLTQREREREGELFDLGAGRGMYSSRGKQTIYPSFSITQEAEHSRWTSDCYN